MLVTICGRLPSWSKFVDGCLASPDVLWAVKPFQIYDGLPSWSIFMVDCLAGSDLVCPDLWWTA